MEVENEDVLKTFALMEQRTNVQPKIVDPFDAQIIKIKVIASKEEVD